MVNYDWNCKTVDCYIEQDGDADVVYNVHWIVTGTSDQLDSEGNPYSTTNIGTQVVPLDSGTPFIPFEDLTNEIIVEWTQDAMGEEQVTDIEANIAASIELLINPTSITLTIS